jgi:hypothetical protein
MLTAEHIKNQFISNPEWEAVFLKHYPNFTPETYIESAKKLFKSNGFTIDEERRSKNPDSRVYCIVEATLLKDGEFVFSLVGHESSIIEELLIGTISYHLCDYNEVDFSKFK